MNQLHATEKLDEIKYLGQHITSKTSNACDTCPTLFQDCGHMPGVLRISSKCGGKQAKWLIPFCHSLVPSYVTILLQDDGGVKTVYNGNGALVLGAAVNSFSRRST